MYIIDHAWKHSKFFFILKQRFNVSIKLTFLLHLQKKPSKTRVVLTTTFSQNFFCLTAADRLVADIINQSQINICRITYLNFKRKNQIAFCGTYTYVLQVFLLTDKQV